MKKLILLSIFAFSTFCIQAANFTWNGGTGIWEDPANWIGGIGVPATGDNVTIGSGEVTMSSYVIVETVTVSGTGSLILAAGANLNILIGTGATIDALEVNGTDASVLVESGGKLTTSNDFDVTNARGIYVLLGGTFINEGEVDVIINDTNVAAIYIRDADATFRNNASGLVQVVRAADSSVEGTGITSFGIFQNAGEIEVLDVMRAGLDLRGPINTNSGIIEVEKAGDDGIIVQSDFTNTNTGTIYIGSRNGVVGEIVENAFLTGNSSTVTNRGLIQIDNFDNDNNSIGDGLFIGQSTFINEGNIDITYSSSTQHGVLAVTSTITNVACANIRSKSSFFIGNTAVLTNDGNIFLDTPEASSIFASAGINGQLTNNGQIEDFQASFNLSAAYFTNNGYVLQPISGMYELNEIIPNVLQGGGAGISVNANVSLDDTGTIIIGSYDQITNEFTATTTDAICENVFYFILNDGNGCPVVMRIPFEHAIIPDPVNANQVMEIKVFLQGPLDATTGLMNDDLRIAGLIPMDDPYGLPPFLSQTITDPTILDDYGPDSIVDWVLLELSLVSDPSNVIRQIPLLLQRDGDVVNWFDAGQVNISLEQTCESYYLRIRHRNHLGVATEFTPTF